MEPNSTVHILHLDVAKVRTPEISSFLLIIVPMSFVAMHFLNGAQVILDLFKAPFDAVDDAIAVQNP